MHVAKWDNEAGYHFSDEIPLISLSKLLLNLDKNPIHSCTVTLTLA